MGTATVGGSLPSLLAAAKELRPATVLMVGIAFGVSEESTPIGTVLVSKQVLQYEIQRIGTQSKPDRGDRVSATPRVLSRLRMVKDRIDVRVKFGLLLSGEKLIDNVNFRNDLMQLDSSAIGGEMEGAGLYLAATEKGFDWCIVKGVCDYADGRKNDGKTERQAVAGKNAARFVIDALTQGGFTRGGSDATERSEFSTRSGDATSSSAFGPKEAERAAITEKSASGRAGVAYVVCESGAPLLRDVVSTSVAGANTHDRGYYYEVWNPDDVAGGGPTSPIVERINEIAFVVVDITYLNPNAVYLVGFAIGHRKRVLLVRHRDTPGDMALAYETGIFDTLGFEQYDSTSDLIHLLTKEICLTPHSFNPSLDRRVPVYVVEPPLGGLTATTMISRLKKARYRYRSFNPVEDVRLSAVDAIQQVAKSSGVLASLQNDLDQVGKVNNLRSLFVAGLAHGMGKPTLLLCDPNYTPPPDVRAEVRTCRDEEDIGRHVHDFALDITAFSQQVDPPPVSAGTMLQSLRIGDPTAENEMTTLADYYLRLDQYDRALRGEVNLLVGRKGSGKTAMFIRVRDTVRRDKRNIVLDLKPEGYQLIKLKEDVLKLLSEGAQQHLVTAFWEYLLLLEIAYKLLEKDRNTYKHNHGIREAYLELDGAYRVENFTSRGDFSERLMMLSNRLCAAYTMNYGEEARRKLTAKNISELLYCHDLKTLRDQIASYLERKQSVWVLFDNLDKGWSTRGIDATDMVVLRCLIDAGKKLERDMMKRGHELHCIVFIRNDVYELLMQHSADYGKEMRAVLDWTDPDLLREMLRLRLVAGLNETERTEPFDRIWPNICVSHHQGEETSSYMIDRSLMRPRNLLKIFSHCRGFAANFGHSRLEEADIEKGMLAYSHDLLIELDRELVDVFPAAKDLIYHFIDISSVVPRPELEAIIVGADIATGDVSKVVEFLLYYGIIGLRQGGEDLYIYDVNYDPSLLRVRVKRAGDRAEFVINPAFWPALGVRV